MRVLPSCGVVHQKGRWMARGEREVGVAQRALVRCGLLAGPKKLRRRLTATDYADSGLAVG